MISAAIVDNPPKIYAQFNSTVRWMILNKLFLCLHSSTHFPPPPPPPSSPSSSSIIIEDIITLTILLTFLKFLWSEKENKITVTIFPFSPAAVDCFNCQLHLL